MKRLSAEAFELARWFIEAKARPLERALFAFRIDGGPSTRVIAELSRFANEDGGFGHALEPDVRTPASSALATALALRTLEDIDCVADHPLVRGAVDWLVSTYDPEARVWRVVPIDTNDHPHAPWWHDEDGSLARTFNGFQIIPRALIVGLLRRFGQHIPTDWLDEVTESTVRYVEDVDVLGSGGGSDLEYVVHLAQTDALPNCYEERLIARIREAIPQVVVRDPAKWSTYCITPLRAAPSPDSVGAELIRADLQQHLDFLIDRQSIEGAWDPTWTYEYPPEWAVARQEWRGILTLEALTTLEAFGRLQTDGS
jgi:hypothetical protein